LEEVPEVYVIQEVDAQDQYPAEEYWTELLGSTGSVDLLNIQVGHWKNPASLKRLGIVPEKKIPGKLTEDQVREIRQSSESLRVLAGKHGVSWISIRNVRIGKTYQDVI
jgi:hypothetical protein